MFKFGAKKCDKNRIDTVLMWFWYSTCICPLHSAWLQCYFVLCVSCFVSHLCFVVGKDSNSICLFHSQRRQRNYGESSGQGIRKCFAASRGRHYDVFAQLTDELNSVFISDVRQCNVKLILRMTAKWEEKPGAVSHLKFSCHAKFYRCALFLQLD